MSAASGDASDSIRAAKQLHPDILAIARTTYVSEVPALSSAGAEVVSAEAEVGFAMWEAILEHLGASADQVDRARDRIRAEMREATRQPV